MVGAVDVLPGCRGPRHSVRSYVYSLSSLVLSVLNVELPCVSCRGITGQSGRSFLQNLPTLRRLPQIPLPQQHRRSLRTHPR